MCAGSGELMGPVPSLPYAGGGGEFGALYLWFVMSASALVYRVSRRGFEPLCFSSAKSEELGRARAAELVVEDGRCS